MTSRRPTGGVGSNQFQTRGRPKAQLDDVVADLEIGADVGDHSGMCDSPSSPSVGASAGQDTGGFADLACGHSLNGLEDPPGRAENLRCPVDGAETFIVNSGRTAVDLGALPPAVAKQLRTDPSMFTEEGNTAVRDAMATVAATHVERDGMVPTRKTITDAYSAAFTQVARSHYEVGDTEPAFWIADVAAAHLDSLGFATDDSWELRAECTRTVRP